MSCRRGYPTKELQLENDRLIKLYLGQDVLSIDQIIDEYASSEFKAYINEPEDIEIIDV